MTRRIRIRRFLRHAKYSRTKSPLNGSRPVSWQPSPTKPIHLKSKAFNFSRFLVQCCCLQGFLLTLLCGIKEKEKRKEKKKKRQRTSALRLFRFIIATRSTLHRETITAMAGSSSSSSQRHHQRHRCCQRNAIMPQFRFSRDWWMQTAEVYLWWTHCTLYSHAERILHT